MKVQLLYYGEDDLEFRGLFLDTLSKVNLKYEEVDLKPGNRYLVLYNDDAKSNDEQPHLILRDKYHQHMGPRGEGFYDYTMCDYLTTRNLIYFKFIYKRYQRKWQWIEEEQYEAMSNLMDQIKLKLRNPELETGVSRRTGKRWYRFAFDTLKNSSEDVINFCTKENYVKPQTEIKRTVRARTRDEITQWMEYLINKPDDTVMGYDFESHGGMPTDSPDFEDVGLGISCCDDEATGIYFDTQWMRYRGKDGEFELFKEYLNKYLDKFENSVTYNNSFEQKATYLLLHRLCLFEEGATANKVDGKVYKRFSLKWTIQRCLHLKSYDDDFDYLTGDALPDIFEQREDGTYVWSPNKDDENYYKNCPAWPYIMELFGSEEDEFDYLITTFWGDPFACIPSNIHKEYCTRDAYYTGLLKQYCLSKYTPLCYYTYCNNLRLEALLHLTGCFLDMDTRNKMELQSLWMIVWGKLNICKWAVHEQLKWYENLHIPEIPMISKFLSIGYDPCDSKSIIMDHLNDTSESGIDEEFFKEYYGEELTKMIIDYIREYCMRMDTSFSRSRKVFSEINWELEQYFNPSYGENNEYCSWTIDGKQYKVDIPYNILANYYNLKVYEVMVEIFLNQFKFEEINHLMLPHTGSYNLPKKLYVPKDIVKIALNKEVEGGWGERLSDIYDVDKEEYTLDDILDWTDTVFNYKSIKISPYFKFMVYDKYKWTILRACVTDYEKFNGRKLVTEEEFRSINPDEYKRKLEEFGPLKIEEDAPSLIGIDQAGFDKSEAKKWYPLHKDNVYALYEAIDEGNYLTKPTSEKDKNGNPVMTWDSRIEDWMNLMNSELSTGWYDFLMRFMAYWSLNDDDLEYFYNHVDEINITDDTLFAYTKLSVAFTAAKKYEKILGTYIRGHFTSYNANTEGFDENGVTAVQYKGPYTRAFMPFFANEKRSKRWSSPWHTIPSKSECKRIVTCPPGYLSSYFDISGCEIRTISYKSEDDFMMDCYNRGIDPYIQMSKFTFPDHADDMKYLKSWRPVFKQILLGCLYGMGEDKMAELADIDVETARKVMDDMWKRSPKMKEFVDRKSAYCVDHNGFVESALGDVLEMDPDDDADRYQRQGINQFIQNYSSVSLADGFENCIAHSIHHDDEKIPGVVIQPLGVIHDSSQFYFTTTYLFRMDEYYRRNLTDYLYKIHGVYYTFDLNIFTNFYDECEMNQLDEHHIEFKANYRSLKALVNKCKEDGLKFRITKLVDGDGNEISVNGFDFGPEFKPKLHINAIEQFISYELKAKYNEDESKFKMTFEELPGNPGWTWSDEELAKIEYKPEPRKVEWKAPF